MAHFAKVNNGIVEKVIVAEQEFIDNLVDTSPGEYIQTSYNTIGGVNYREGGVPLRKNYAIVGGIYDYERDAFYSQKPYPSWILNEDTCIWESPVDYPDDGNMYTWDEENTQWELI